MSVNKNVVYGQSTNIDSSQHNVMQPTSPLHGYPPGSSPYGYVPPGAVRSSGIATSHWRSVGYTSQANWALTQSQASFQNQHHLQDNIQSRQLPVSQPPVTSNTVHYHGDHLSTVSSPNNLTHHSTSLGQGWSSHVQSWQHNTQASHTLSSSTSNTVHLELKQEQKSEDEDYMDPNLLRHKVLEFYMEAMEHVRVTYRDKLQELFFLQNGGNLVDYHGWRKRPNPQLVAFLNASRLDHEMSVSTPTATNTVSPSIQAQAVYGSQPYPVFMYQGARQPSTDHGDNRQLHGQQGKPIHHPQATVSPAYPLTYGFAPQVTHSTSQQQSSQPVSTTVTQADTTLGPQQARNNAQPQNASGNREAQVQRTFAPTVPSPYAGGSLSSMYGNPLGTQEDIAMQARKEQDILQRVAELRKEGLWSASRLPKVYEPPRKKAHWDYLLEEMQWLATDFAQERRWKRNMARKVGT